MAPSNPSLSAGNTVEEAEGIGETGDEGHQGKRLFKVTEQKSNELTKTEAAITGPTEQVPGRLHILCIAQFSTFMRLLNG